MSSISVFHSCIFAGVNAEMKILIYCVVRFSGFLPMAGLGVGRYGHYVGCAAGLSSFCLLFIPITPS